MKTYVMLFKADFMALILGRIKEQTRRIKHRDIKPGDKLLAKTSYHAKTFAELKVISVGSEYLRDISVWDAYMEGIYSSGKMRHLQTIEKFAKLWDSINKEPGTKWKDNPLVQVIRFKLIRWHDTPETRVVSGTVRSLK